MFEHACNVYKEMVVQSEIDPELGLRVYDGHLTNLFKKLRLAVPYYTDIRNRLISIGCIEQLRRGGGSATSRWVLWKEPDLDEWKLSSSRRPGRGNTMTVLQQQMKDMMAMMRQLEMRVSRLEGSPE